MELTGTPETLGLGAVIIALITAWVKIRPAIRKIESEENTSLRSDLLQRIRDLETAAEAQRKAHEQAIRDIRTEYELMIQGMREQHDSICRDYEDKLTRFQTKVDELMKLLLAHNNVKIVDEGNENG